LTASSRPEAVRRNDSGVGRRASPTSRAPGSSAFRANVHSVSSCTPTL